MSLDQSNFEILEGVLTKYTGKEEILVLPEGICAIGWGAFADQKTLRSVTLPKGLLRIGVEAFAGCTELTEVILPCSVEFINFSAFAE